MESATLGTQLGDALETCLMQSKAKWLSEHQAGRDLESAWTSEIVETHLMCQLKHGGRANAQVTVLSRKHLNSETFAFHLQIRGNLGWLIVASNIT